MPMPLSFTVPARPPALSEHAAAAPPEPRHRFRLNHAARPRRCRPRSPAHTVSCSAAVSVPSDAQPPPPAPVPARAKKFSLLGVFFASLLFLYAAFWFAVMLVLHPLVKLRDNTRRRAHDYIAMLWMRMTMYTSLFFPKVFHRERLPPLNKHAVYVVNHNSLLDIFVLAALRRPLKYVSKIEIFRVPLIGTAMRLANHVGLKRGDRRGQLEAYKAMLKMLNAGANLVVFPEGTRSKDGKLRAFQKGAFKVALSTGLPIVPVTIVGTREAMPPDAILPVRFPPHGFNIYIGEPIDPAGKTDKQLSDMTFAAINAELPDEYRVEL